MSPSLAVLLARALLAAIAVGLAVVVGTLVRYAIASRRPRHFPPGPPTLPIVGNAHLLPHSHTFLKFREWRQEYGDIYGLKLGPTNAVVLCSHKHVQELFEKRGTIYSSRPHNHLFNDYICPGDDHILFLPYGDAWRKQRKAMNSLLNVNAVSRILPVQDAESTQLVHDILEKPADFFTHIRRYACAVILAAAYGLRGPTYDSINVQGVFRVQDQLSAFLAPGATPPLDGFTFLQYLPDWLATWRPKARAIHEQHHRFYFDIFRRTKERWLNGGPECMMTQLIAKQEKNEMTDAAIVHTGTPMLEAGSETTAATVHTFLLAMVTHPELLRKLQTEVDAVCGRDRLPGPADIDRLPYVQAVVHETLRWRPATSTGIPHIVTEDDHYNGYFIPAGTMVFASTWAIHTNEDEYTDPLSFNPSRFLDSQEWRGLRGSANDDGNTPDHPAPSALPAGRRITFAFGAGRRACPGERMALNSLMIIVAKLAWAFDISEDPAHPVDTSFERGYRDGISQQPNPFRVRFHPRGPERAAVVAAAWEKADAFLRQYE